MGVTTVALHLSGACSARLAPRYCFLAQADSVPCYSSSRVALLLLITVSPFLLRPLRWPAAQQLRASLAQAQQAVPQVGDAQRQ